MQILERGDLGGHATHGDADAAALPIDVDAVAPEPRQRVSEVDLAVLREAADLAVVALLGLAGLELVNELAMIFPLIPTWLDRQGSSRLPPAPAFLRGFAFAFACASSIMALSSSSIGLKRASRLF